MLVKVKDRNFLPSLGRSLKKDLGKIFLALFFAFAISSCSQEPVEESAAIIRPAKLIVVESSSNITRLNLPAVISAQSSVELAFETSGFLQDFPVIESQVVAEGELIAQLDQTNFINALDTAQAQYDNAAAEFNRAEVLIADNAISQSIFENRKTQMNVAEIALENALKQQEDSILRAPFAGIIATKIATQFQNITPQNPVVILQSVGDAEASVRIPSTLVANINNLEPISTTVILDASPNTPIPGEFYSAETTTDPGTQTFNVSFTFTPPEQLLILPGMTGAVLLELQTTNEDATKSIYLPTSAINSDGVDSFVWLVNTTDMTASKQIVTIKSGIGERLEILSGISEGDTVVGAGGSYLFEGMTIKAYEE